MSQWVPKLPPAMKAPLAALRGVRLQLVDGVNRFAPTRTTPDVTAALDGIERELTLLADAAAHAPPSDQLAEALAQTAQAAQALAAAYAAKQRKGAAPGIRGQQETAAA